MRAFIFLTLVAAVSADLCRTGKKGKAEDKERIENIKSAVRTAATMVLGSSCPDLAEGIDDVVFSGSCRSLAKKAMCYGFRVEERYADKEVVSYRKLAKGVDDVREMGKVACDEAEDCFKQVAKAVKKCIKTNPNFVEDTITAVETVYRAKAQQYVEEFIESNRDTLFGELADLAMREFTSASDIRDFIDEHISGNLRERIVSEARETAQELVTLYREFCGDGCTDEIADFAKSMFKAMHQGECTDATEFCGACQDNANNWLDMDGNDIPCCFNKVVKKAIQAYDYIAETYGERIEDFAEQVSAKLSAKANSKIAEIRDNIVTQARCVAATYRDYRPECPMA